MLRSSAFVVALFKLPPPLISVAILLVAAMLVLTIYVAVHWRSSGMFGVSEAEAAKKRTAFEQEGELSAGIELRRLSPGSRTV